MNTSHEGIAIGIFDLRSELAEPVCPDLEEFGPGFERRPRLIRPGPWIVYRHSVGGEATFGRH